MRTDSSNHTDNTTIDSVYSSELIGILLGLQLNQTKNCGNAAT